MRDGAMLYNISITQLQYIIAIEKYGNFSKAAENSYVTQPTLSMQVQKLEEELGIVLFDRSKKPVKPTNAGKAVLMQAKKIIKELEILMLQVAQEKDQVAGQFHLGVIPTLSPYILPAFISEFQKKYPLVQLQIEEKQTQQIIKDLQNENLDAGILVSPIKDSQILETPIFWEEFYVYHAKEHPIKNLQEVSTKDLKAEGLWLLADGHCFRNQALAVCSDDFHESNIHFLGGNFETIKNLVDQNRGYSLFPKLAVESMKLDPKRVKKLKKKVFREISIVTSRSYIKKAILDAIEDALRISLPPELQVKPKGDPVPIY